MRRIPVREVIDDPETDANIRRKLMLIQQTRRFAKEVMGLEVGDSYTTYFDTDDEPIIWNVTATPKDSLEPITWDFPIIGKVPYLGYFKKKDAKRKKSELLALGYDVEMTVVDGYSLLGYLDDPIFSSMLDEGDERIVNVIIHELAHANIYVADNTDFNETIATFLGDEGAAQFFENWLNNTEVRKTLQEFRGDEEIFSVMVQDAYLELKELYARQDISSSQKIIKREEIFGGLQKKIEDAHDKKVFHNDGKYHWISSFQLDNAFILSRVRNYGGVEYIIRLHKSFGGDLKRTVEALRWSAKKNDPLGVIRENTSLDEEGK